MPILKHMRRASEICRWRVQLLLATFMTLSLLPGMLWAVPGDVLFSDNFNNLNSWTVSSSGGDASNANGNEISNGGNRALQLRWGPVSVTSDPINANVPGAEVSVWIKRGFNSYGSGNNQSDAPEAGDNLVLEYLTAGNLWVALAVFPGDGPPAEVFEPTYSLPVDGLHAGLRLRFRLTAGGGSAGNNGVGEDYWHIDDLIVKETAPVVTLALWRFDEAGWNNGAGQARDETGTYHGTPFNGLNTGGATPALSGNPGTCRYGDFDGQDDFVELPANFPNLQGSFTITAWIRARELDKDQRIFADDEQNTGGFAFSLGDAAAGRLRFFSRAVNPTILDTQTAVIGVNTWHFVAVVHNASAKTRQIYVDGVAATLDNGAPIATYTGNWGVDNGRASIGGETDNAGSEAVSNWRFNGLIDEVQVFSSALSAAQINEIMARRHPCQTPPVADWRFDEHSWSGVAGEVKDSSGNNYHGTAFNSSPRLGKICNAADLRADSNSDYLSMHNGALNGRSDFTISVWAKSVTHNGISTLMSGAYYLPSNQGLGANELFMLFDGATTFRPGISAALFADTPGISVPAINDNQWHHYVWTRDAAARTSCLYRDGLLRGCITHPNANDSNPLTIAVGGLIIGQDQDVVGGGFEQSQDWQGDLDEILIFDRVLAVTEIQEIHAQQSLGNNWDGTPRICPVSAVLDHFQVDHDTTAITCAAEPVTIVAHQSDHSLLSSYTGTINLTTSTGRGDWTLFSGNGTLNNGVAGDGAATYSFAAADNGRVELRLANTVAETLSINVADGAVTENSGAALANEDRDLTFAETGFRVLANGVESAMPTQIAGKNSSIAPNAATLELQAVQTSSSTGACAALFVGNATVEMAFETLDPTSANGREVRIIGIGAGAQTADIAANDAGLINSYSNITLAFDGTGRAPFQFTYADAGRIRLHARYQGTPTGVPILGASNTFVTKPAGLCVAATDVNADCSSPLANCSVFKRAGEDFALSVRAVVWENTGQANADFCNGNATTPNFRLSDIGLMHNLVAPSGGDDGDPLPVSSVSIGPADNGEATVANQRISEVGVFSITATPMLYFGELIAPSTSANIGRFIPSRFELGAGTVGEACMAGAFTYLAQPFGIAYELTAYNLAGGVTQNYAGDFAKLNTGLGNVEFGAIDLSKAPAQPLTPRLSDNGIDNFVWNSGVGQIGHSLMMARAAAPDGPFIASIGALPTDADGVTIPLASRMLDDLLSAVDFAPVANSIQRYGRLFINNAYGPEELDLAMTLQAEYFDGARFVMNAADSCTAFAAANSLQTNFTGNLNLGDADVIGPGLTLLSNGRNPATAPLLLDKAGAGNDGSVDVILNVEDWLKFNYDGVPGDDNPRGTATFGQFRGSDRIIYWREKIPVR